jgi:DNA modification methylase
MSEHACAKILCADARALPFPDASVDLIVTSPPYWAQRSDGSEIGDESLATVCSTARARWCAYSSQLGRSS